MDTAEEKISNIKFQLWDSIVDIVRILNVDAILVFQPSLTSHTRSVVHDVPVGVIPQRNWDDYEESAMPDFDVSVNYFLLSSPFFFYLTFSFT